MDGAYPLLTRSTLCKSTRASRQSDYGIGRVLTTLVKEPSTEVYEVHTQHNASERPWITAFVASLWMGEGPDGGENNDMLRTEYRPLVHWFLPVWHMAGF